MQRRHGKIFLQRLICPTFAHGALLASVSCTRIVDYFAKVWTSDWLCCRRFCRHCSRFWRCTFAIFKMRKCRINAKISYTHVTRSWTETFARVWSWCACWCLHNIANEQQKVTSEPQHTSVANTPIVWQRRLTKRYRCCLSPVLPGFSHCMHVPHSGHVHFSLQGLEWLGHHCSHRFSQVVEPEWV